MKFNIVCSKYHKILEFEIGETISWKGSFMKTYEYDSLINLFLEENLVKTHATSEKIFQPIAQSLQHSKICKEKKK